MKYSISIILILHLLLQTSCESRSKKLTDSFIDQQDIRLKTVEGYPTDSIGAPTYIYSFGNFIILVEPKMENLLSAYDLSTKSYKRFLTKGRGPNELLDIQQIGTAKEKDAFFVLDTYTKKTFVYSTTDTFRTIRYQITVPTQTSTFCCDSNLIIGNQSGEEERFFVKDENTNKKIEFGNHINISNYTQNTISQALAGFCVHSGINKKIIWFSLYGDLFEIYAYNDKTNIKLINQTLGLHPVFTEESIKDKKIPVFSSKTKMGVTSLAANDKYIFALYNENLLKEAPKLKDNIFYSNKILIYDWNGNPIKIINLNEKVKAISYNEEKHAIYCIACDEISPKILYMDCHTIL